VFVNRQIRLGPRKPLIFGRNAGFSGGNEEPLQTEAGEARTQSGDGP
jgi:hypothetical protein